MAELNWTVEAQNWLKQIYDYIALDNPQAAARVVEGIYEKANLLRQFPLLGYTYEANSDRDVRILLYGHFRIVYLVRDEQNIDVLGVFHGAMEIKRYLV